MTVSSEPVIRVRGLTFGYGREKILDDVDLDIGARDFLAIIGPNGGGKTTLVKILLGLLQPWSGEIHSTLTKRPGSLGYVPQFAAFDRDFPLRVFDVVQATDVQDSMGPTALGDQLNDVTDSGAPLYQHHVTGFDLVAYALKVTQGRVWQWPFVPEPVLH